MNQQRIGDGICHRHGGIEARQGVLKHHLDGATHRFGIPSPGQQQVPFEQLHSSSANGSQPHQSAAERAFAAAGSAHHSQGFACFQLKADPIDRLQPVWGPGRPPQVVPAAQLLHVQHHGC